MNDANSVPTDTGWVSISGIVTSSDQFEYIGTNDLYTVRTASSNPTPGTINVYFNFRADTSVAIPGNSATGNVDFAEKLIDRINQSSYSIDLALYSFSGIMMKIH
jgi:hypothetical protein